MITVGKNMDNKAIYGTVKFLCDYQSDVANLPNNRKPGSTAYVIENGNRYILNSNKEWVLQPAGGGGGVLPPDDTTIIYDGGDVTLDDPVDTIVYDGGLIG